MDLKTYIGQTHLVGTGKPIRRIIAEQKPTSMILYGPPGIGKTTLANIIADNLNITRFNLNAATMALKELKEIVAMHKMHGKIIIIMDEIHRLDTIKQNYLLPFLETDEVFIIGTTTENPYFAVNSAMRSRLLLFNLKSISEEELSLGLKAMNEANFPDTMYADNIFTIISAISAGDVRIAKNIFNFLQEYYDVAEVNPELLYETFNNNIAYDSGNGEYYDLLSALQKSIRASDVNAAMHYAARCLIVGDHKSLWRRLIVTAYEDISLANPECYQRAELGAQSFDRVGMPEGRIIVANVVVEMALSPKTISAYKAMDAAMNDLKTKKIGDIPGHLIYNQPHKDDYDRDIADQIDNLPRNLMGTEYFESWDAGRYERALNQNYINRKKNLKPHLRKKLERGE